MELGVDRNNLRCAVTLLVEALRCKLERRWLDSHGVTAIFHGLESFRPHCDPRSDSASNRNECQKYLLRGEGDQGVGLTTFQPLCADYLEIPGTSASWVLSRLV